MALSFRKVPAVPVNPIPDCMYLIDNGTGLDVHMTSSDGSYTRATMTLAQVQQMINAGSTGFGLIQDLPALP